MSLIRPIAAFGSLLLLTTVVVYGVNPWTNNQNAVSVLGQTDFIQSTAAAGASGMFQPNSVRFDSVSGKVFVSECANNRVLRYANAQAMTSGGAAEAVFGQTDVNGVTFGATATKLNCPSEITTDSSGRLWVVDTMNNRVLRWDGAGALTSGQPANAVLGQPDFTTTSVGISSIKMTSPQGIFADGAGRIWIADTGNNRILRFDDAGNKANGAAANGVLGQLNFNANSPNMSQSTLQGPTSVTGDAAGSIWVSDAGNDRVLRFDLAASKSNGGVADSVLGSTVFDSVPGGGAGTTTVSTFSSPGGVMVDNNNRLYVADTLNNRILIFNNANILTNGFNANTVIGQPTFIDSTARLTQSGFDLPYTPSWDATTQSMWVPDLANNRVVRFTAQAPTAGTVTVSGRVLDASGVGLRNARVTFVDPNGLSRTAITNSFGYYQFLDITSGALYTATVSVRGYTFQTRSVQAQNDLANVDFMPQ